MVNLFGRKYSLIVGNPKTITQPQTITRAGETFHISSLFPNTIPQVVSEQDFREIRDLQIRAILPQTKTISAEAADKAYIEVYNLSPTTLEFIQKSTLMFLKGGYVQDKELSYLFTGEIQAVSTEKKGVDTVTTLLCGQMVKLGRNVRVQKTYNEGSSFQSILVDLLQIARDNHIPIGRTKLPVANGEYYKDVIAENQFINRALPIEGHLISEITRVASMCGYRAYISLGKLYIEPATNPEIRDVVQIHADNIQGSIKQTMTTSFDRSNEDNKTEVSVNLFLNGDISVSKRIQIMGGNFKGMYDITNVEHHLDYEGVDWTTKVKARRIS